MSHSEVQWISLSSERMFTGFYSTVARCAASFWGFIIFNYLQHELEVPKKQKQTKIKKNNRPTVWVWFQYEWFEKTGLCDLTNLHWFADVGWWLRPHRSSTGAEMLLGGDYTVTFAKVSLSSSLWQVGGRWGGGGEAIKEKKPLLRHCQAVVCVRRSTC